MMPFGIVGEYMIKSQPDSYRIPIQVAVYCYRRGNNGIIQWLMLKRATNTNPCWQGVTGAPFEGEALIDAAGRELFEETGLRPLSLVQSSYSYTYTIPAYNRHKFAYDAKTITEYVFVAQINAAHEDVVLTEEHVEYCWVGFDEAQRLLSWQENKKSLQIVYRMITREIL
jgi:dATP pyrophosphohydrolase